MPSFYLLEWLYAQQPKFYSACKEQIIEICNAEHEKKDFRGIIKCLQNNEAKLSNDCKQEIQRAVKVVGQTTPPGGGPLGMLGGMTSLGALVPMLTYEGRVVPAGDEKKSPAVLENNFRLSVPVYKSESHTVSTSVSSNILHLDKRVEMNTGYKLPHDFYRSELGTSVYKKT